MEVFAMREALKKAKARYQHKAPKFRLLPSPRDQFQWRRSVYYWWWRYLRLNEEYRRCCERGGRGSMAKLYKDFGNVFDGDDFRAWWLTDGRGETLFAEPAPQLTVNELRRPREWDATWQSKDVMVVAIALSEPKWRITRSMAALLKERHSGKPGVATQQRSGAHYAVSGKFSVPALEKMCKVYELRHGKDKLTLERIGKKAGIDIEFTQGHDELDDDARRRNVMAATVSRYLKKAQVLVDNVGRGMFPCFDPVA
jgi:hypothetical protein